MPIEGTRSCSRGIVVALAATCLLVIGAGTEPAPNRAAAPPPAPSARLATQHYADCRAACHAGDLAMAERRLLDAVRAGFDDFSVVQRDDALAPLREGRVYRAILAARDAADPVLVARTLNRWQDRLDGRYCVHADDDRKLTVLSSRCGAPARRLHGRIAQLVDDLHATLFPPPLRHGVLVVLPRPADAAGLFPHGQIRGVYRHRTRTLIALDVNRSLRHELVHALHHNHMDRLGQDHAMWILEGLAALYEHAATDKDGVTRFVADDRDLIVRRLAETDRLLRWPELLSMPASSFESDAARTYAQSRSICRFVAERGLLESWYAAYVREFDLDGTGRLALEAVFDQPLETIEQAWRRWLVEEDATSVAAALGHDGAPADAAALDSDAVEDLSSSPGPGATSRGLPTLAERMGAGARDSYEAGDYAHAARLLRRVVDLNPRDARARYELGLTSVRLGDRPGAEAQHEVLVELDPSLANLLGNLLRE